MLDIGGHCVLPSSFDAVSFLDLCNSFNTSAYAAFLYLPKFPRPWVTSIQTLQSLPMSKGQFLNTDNGLSKFVFMNLDSNAGAFRF